MVYAKLKGRNGTLLYISFCISFFRKKIVRGSLIEFDLEIK